MIALVAVIVFPTYADSSVKPTSGETTNVSFESGQQIPSSVKNTAELWASGQVGDSDFINGLQSLIQQGIIQVPSQQVQSTTTVKSIPSWVKYPAGWWASGQISDSDFISGMQFLMQQGIIQVPSSVPTGTRDKIIISFIRPDLDPTSLANVVSYVQSFSQPTDFIFGGGISGYEANWPVDRSVPGQLMTSGVGTTQSQANWLKYKQQEGVSVVFFDEEPTLSVADVEAGYKVAKSMGLKFVTTPTYNELAVDPSVITTVAQNSDIVNLQIFPGMKFTGPDAGLTYAQCVQKYAESARQANPNVKIFVQYITGPHKTNTGDMTKQIDAFNSVKSYVDGVFIWYYKTPDPTPVLKQFYQGTGLVG